MNRATATAQADFYVTGGTLARDAPCYVERRPTQELYEGLRQGQFCYVLTARQMGKSSLMVRTAARLREEGCGVAVLDLTAIGQNLTAEQWYEGCSAQIGAAARAGRRAGASSGAASARFGPLQRWTAGAAGGGAAALSGPRRRLHRRDRRRPQPAVFDRRVLRRHPRVLQPPHRGSGARRGSTFCLLGVATAVGPDPGHPHDAVQHRARGSSCTTSRRQKRAARRAA